MAAAMAQNDGAGSDRLTTIDAPTPVTSAAAPASASGAPSGPGNSGAGPLSPTATRSIVANGGTALLAQHHEDGESDATESAQSSKDRASEGGQGVQQPQPQQPYSRTMMAGPIQRSTSAPPQLALQGLLHVDLVNADLNEPGHGPTVGAGAGSSRPPSSSASGNSHGGFDTASHFDPHSHQTPSQPLIINGETIQPNDQRLTEEYYNYYHSQKPLDPRLPPPLVQWNPAGHWPRGGYQAGAGGLFDPRHTAQLQVADSPQLSSAGSALLGPTAADLHTLSTLDALADAEHAEQTQGAGGVQSTAKGAYTPRHSSSTSDVNNSVSPGANGNASLSSATPAAGPTATSAEDELRLSALTLASTHSDHSNSNYNNNSHNHMQQQQQQQQQQQHQLHHHQQLQQLQQQQQYFTLHQAQQQAQQQHHSHPLQQPSSPYFPSPHLHPQHLFAGGPGQSPLQLQQLPPPLMDISGAFYALPPSAAGLGVGVGGGGVGSLTNGSGASAGVDPNLFNNPAALAAAAAAFFATQQQQQQQQQGYNQYRPVAPVQPNLIQAMLQYNQQQQQQAPMRGVPNGAGLLGQPLQPQQTPAPQGITPEMQAVIATFTQIRQQQAFAGGGGGLGGGGPQQFGVQAPPQFRGGAPFGQQPQQQPQQRAERYGPDGQLLPHQHHQRGGRRHHNHMQHQQQQQQQQQQQMQMQQQSHQSPLQSNYAAIPGMPPLVHMQPLGLMDGVNGGGAGGGAIPHLFPLHSGAQQQQHHPPPHPAHLHPSLGGAHHAHHPHRDWDDFRNSKTNVHLTLHDMIRRGVLVELATDQHGSRFIQQRLEIGTDAERAAGCEAVLPELVRLSHDVFGNYVIQKFLEHGTFEQRRACCRALVGHVYPLSLQMYGCRVIQKCLEVTSASHASAGATAAAAAAAAAASAAASASASGAEGSTSPNSAAATAAAAAAASASASSSAPLGDPETQRALVSELNHHVLSCIKDQNGNHVIQKAIEKVAPQDIPFIIDIFEGQVYNLSIHPYGCRVVQRVLEHVSASPNGSGGAASKAREQILREIGSNVEELCRNQYGNYVIQHILKHGTAEQKSSILRAITGIGGGGSPSHAAAAAAAAAGANGLSPKASTTSPRTNQPSSSGHPGSGVEINPHLGPASPSSATSPSGGGNGNGSGSSSSNPSPRSTKVFQLAKHKFASNVVEKCFTHAGPRERMELIDQIIGRENERVSEQNLNSPFLSLVKDQYGNYVIQKMIDESNDEERVIVIARIRKHINNLRKIPYGKHIIAKIEKLTGKPFQ